MTVLTDLLLIAPPVILIWALQRWWRTSPRISPPVWRSYVAIAAIGLAGVSVLLWFVSGFRARAVGGFYVDDRALIWFVRFGFLAGPAGFLARLVWEGTVRGAACGLSAFMTLLWIATWVGGLCHGGSLRMA